MAYWIRSNGPERFQIVRDGLVILTCGGAREFAERQRRVFEEDEAASQRAIASGDPQALCRLGWHRLDPGSGPPLKARTDAGFRPTPFFRFATRIGEAGGTLVFRVADRPFRYAARSVKTLGN